MKFMRMKFTIETILNECCKLMNENVMFIKSCFSWTHGLGLSLVPIFCRVDFMVMWIYDYLVCNELRLTYVIVLDNNGNKCVFCRFEQ